MNTAEIILQQKRIAAEKREKAPIVGKNVTTDWIESVFDSFDYTRDRDSAVGFVNHHPVLVAWSDNTMIWKAILGEDDCLNVLEIRLAAFEDPNYSLYSERKRVGDLIIQSFYIKEED